MSIEDNKAVARRFIETIGNLDGDSLGEMMSEDFRFYTMFRSAGHPLVSVFTKQEFCEYQKVARKMFPQGVRHEVRGMIGEGDLVALESECFAELPTGARYNNLFHFRFRIADGKVLEIKEYADFLHFMEVVHPDYEKAGLAIG